jgi:hypothetical protein
MYMGGQGARGGDEALVTLFDLNARIGMVFDRFADRDFTTALSLADALKAEGAVDPLLGTLLAHLGIICGTDDTFACGLAMIDSASALDPNAPWRVKGYDADFISGHVCGALARGDERAILALLEISRRINPALAAIFPDSVERMISRPPEPRRNLIGLSAVPTKISPGQGPKRSLRANLYLNPWFFGPSGRRHDLGPRMARAFNGAGWPAQLIEPPYIGDDLATLDADSLALRMGDGAPDVIIFDNQRCNISPAIFGQAAAQLRRDNADLRFVLLLPDPWLVDFWPDLRLFAPMVDAIWAPSPGAGILSEAIVADKVFCATYPIGVGLDELPAQTRAPVTAFQGAVEWYNYARAYWLALLAAAKSPVRRVLTHHRDDGLSPIDSFKIYLSRFQSVDRQISLSMRRDGTRMATGRSFETIFTGACLLQEQTDDMAYFGFEAGRHYLSFTTFDDLMDQLAFGEQNPDAVKTLAARAQAFYLSTYADPFLVGALEARLGL